METSKLLNTPVNWLLISNSFYYYVEIDNKIIYIRLNNFPEEPLYTIINGLDIVDIDDPPTYWIFNKFVS